MNTGIEEIKRILDSDDPLFEWIDLSEKYQFELLTCLYQELLSLRSDAGEEIHNMIVRHKAKLTAADALAEILKRVYNTNESFLKEGYGCCFCKDGAGHYVDGEYWHSENCPFERIDTTLRQYEATK